MNFRWGGLGGRRSPPPQKCKWVGGLGGCGGGEAPLPPTPIQKGLLQKGLIQKGPIQKGPIQKGPIQKGLIQKGRIQNIPKYHPK